jgi:hypothetical protein
LRRILQHISRKAKVKRQKNHELYFVNIFPPVLIGSKREGELMSGERDQQRGQVEDIKAINII